MNVAESSKDGLEDSGKDLQNENPQTRSVTPAETSQAPEHESETQVPDHGNVTRIVAEQSVQVSNQTQGALEIVDAQLKIDEKEAQRDVIMQDVESAIPTEAKRHSLEENRIPDEELDDAQLAARFHEERAKKRRLCRSITDFSIVSKIGLGMFGEVIPSKSWFNFFLVFVFFFWIGDLHCRIAVCIKFFPGSSFCTQVCMAMDKSTNEYVALKKVLMGNERDGLKYKEGVRISFPP